jgi:hypothetical protein
MEARRLLSLGGAGVVALVAITVAGLGSGTPSNGATGAAVASYYQGHQARAVISAFVIGLTAPLLVAFAATLAATTRRDTGRGVGIAEIVLVGGAVLVAATFLVTAGLQLALADVPDKISPDALQALNVLNSDMWAAWNPAFGVMLFGAAGVLAGADRSLRILGRVAWVLAVAMFVPFADFFGLLATGVWLIAASVVLYRREPARGFAPQPQAA